MMPKISVIIPVYNVEKFLSRCLDSVLDQTFKDFEVVCINDGSTDRSEEILQEYAKKDQRIKVFTQNNQGAAVARNKALQYASGDFVFFLDSDDMIHRQAFSLLVSLAEDSNAELVSFDQLDCTFEDVKKQSLHKLSMNINENDTKITDNVFYLGTHKGEFITHFTVTSKFCKKDLLNGISFIPKNQFEDLAYSYAILAKNPRTVILKKILYYYIINPNGVFHQRSRVKQINDYSIILEYIYNIFENDTAKINFLARDLIPNVLEQQRRRCRKADKAVKKEMYKVFAEELRMLESKNLLVRKYIRIYRYFLYRILMKIY